MARARNIKPGFFTNDDLVELPFEYRLLFIGLWTLADREGRLVDRPKKIKMEIFPADNVDCDEGLDMLAKSGFITRYSANEQSFIQIITWEKHQNPHVKEAKSTIPAPCLDYEEPESNNGESDTSTVQAPDSNYASTIQAPPFPERAGLIPDSGFLIPDSKETTLSGVPDVSPKAQAREILEYLNAKSRHKYRPVDVNLDLIVARLKSGVSVADCKAVVDAKTAQWSADEKMQEYLRPGTLFNRTRFEQYLGQLGNDDPADRFGGMV